MIGVVGRIGLASGRRANPAAPTADFTLSNASVATQWGVVTVGELVPVNAPAGSFFLLVEGTAPSGDDAGLAVVNG